MTTITRPSKKRKVSEDILAADIEAAKSYKKLKVSAERNQSKG